MLVVRFVGVKQVLLRVPGPHESDGFIEAIMRFIILTLIRVRTPSQCLRKLAKTTSMLHRQVAAVKLGDHQGLSDVFAEI